MIREITIVDSAGIPHVFSGGNDLQYWATNAECRVYDSKYGTLASFYGYVSAEYTKKDPKV